MCLLQFRSFASVQWSFSVTPGRFDRDRMDAKAGMRVQLSSLESNIKKKFSKKTKTVLFFCVV